jgi:DNA (cytosine-5)-methyltransferase 1
VFVVGCLGGWESAAKVLFESESLCRDITKGNKKKQEITNASVSSITKSVGAIDLKDISKTLTASYGTGGPDLDIKPLVLEQKSQFVDTYNGTIQGNVAATMTADMAGPTHSGPKVMVSCIGGQHPNAAIGEEISPTLTNAMGAGGGHVPIIGQMAVRRLTEVECERLQGFPDNYTNIKENCPSGPRYKSLGNSMAVPVMRWIGERINKYERL